MKPIGTVNAGNNDYQFTDMNAKAANGNPFLYRLKMVDQDGRFTYSNVLSFRFASSTGITLYPSVIQQGQAFSIAISGESPHPFTIDINNAAGVRVLRQTQMAGTATTISSARLAAGNYFIKAYTGTQQETIRLVIQ